MTNSCLRILWNFPLFFLILFVSCQNGALKIPGGSGLEMEPLFERTIATRQNLVFHFSKPMVKPEQIGIWDTTQLLHFQPAVVGQFKWSGLDELTFSPDHSFAFATTYTASPAASLASFSPEAVGLEPVSFETQQLNILSLEPQRVLESSGLKWLRCRVELNQPVLPDELLPALAFTLQGKPLVPMLEDHQPGAFFYVRFNTPNLSEASQKLEAEIQPSKLPQNLKKWLRKSVKFSEELASQLEVKAYGVNVDYEPEGTFLRVRLNQNSHSETVKKFVEIPGFDGLTVEPHPLGIQVSGDFPSKATLEIVLKKGLKTALGSILKQDQTLGIRIGVSDPFVRFASTRALYLPREGTRELGLFTESVSELQLSIYQVFPNAILSHFNKGYDYYPEEEYYSEYEQVTGSLVFNQTFKTANLKKEGSLTLLPIPKSGLPGQKGIFVLKIADTEHRYVGAQKVVVVTDIGLVAKSNSNEIWVQALSLQENKPIAGATIGVVGQNNQVLFQGQTDAEGQMKVSKNKLLALGSPPAMITCEKDNDFTYLLFNQSQLETSRFPVNGIPVSASGWQTEVFGPRNLYLPGETIDLSVLLRDRNLSAVSETPVLAKVLSPAGKMIQLLKATTSAQGKGNFQFSIPTAFGTGTFSVDIITGDREILATHYLHIESFEPIPLDISAGAPPKFLAAAKDWNLSLAAENMFGLPAGNRPVEAQLSWTPASFYPKGFEEYSFYLNGVSTENQILTSSTQTDGQGKANLILPSSKIPANQGLLDVKARIQIFDDAQIPVYKSIRSQLLTQASLIGFKVPGGRFGLRKLNKIELVSLGPEGNLVAGEAWVDIFLTSYNRVMESAPNEPSGFRYVSRRVKNRILHQRVDLMKGRGIFSFFPRNPGDYEMEIRSSESAAAFLSHSTYVYEGDNEGQTGEEASQEGNIEIGFQNKNWVPGENAQIRFTTPFDGRLTVCLEQDRILKSFSLEVKNKSAVLSLPIQEEMAPNVYLSAVLTREMADSKNQNPLTTAYGYASLPVRRIDRQLATQLKVPAQWTSGQRLPVEIELEPGKENRLSLAVVDDGILQITQYRIPDPMDYFHRKQALTTQTYSMFGKIIQSRVAGRNEPGGDGLYMKMANDELDTRQLLSVILDQENAKREGFGELLEVPGSGGSRFKAWIAIPAGFSGRIRVMALSYNSKKMGFAEKTLLVADPITLKTSLPDFLAPGNRFEGLASFFNTSGKATVFQPALEGNGKVTVQSNWPQTIHLQPGEVKRLPYALIPKSEGQANLTLVARSGAKVLSSKAKFFPVKEPTGLVRHLVSGELTPGQSISLSRPDFLSGGELKASIEIGTEPWLSLTPGLQSLISYPYGCLEQTISTAFPLLYLPDSWIEGHKGKPNTSVPNDKWKKRVFVSDAIHKIASLQQPDGGFSYWPGGDQAYPYYSVYATHFLWEARQAGFSVDPDVLKQAIEFTQEVSKENAIWWYAGMEAARGNWVRKLASKTPYALFVTSLVGKPNQKSLLQWKAQADLLDQEGRYMLACALLLAGDGGSFDRLIPATWLATLSPQKPEKTDPYQTSFIPEVMKTGTQEEAFVLAALSHVWPTHPMAKTLANRLRSNIANHADQLSTQELGMAAASLARQMKATQAGKPSFLASIGSKPILENKSGTCNPGNWNLPVMLKNNHKKEPLYYWIQAQGKGATGKAPEEDKGLILRKTLYDLQGKPIDGSKLSLNSLVIVRLSLTSASGLPVERIALVDMIPACLRVENRRIDQNSDFKTPGPAAEPEHLDIRRDRITLFCSAGKTEKSFYYAARIVGRGKFMWEPTEAQAMYNPALFSRNGSREIQVFERSDSENP